MNASKDLSTNLTQISPYKLGTRLLVTIPHSGEKVPPEATWLSGLSIPILMCDVDRFVDKLYIPGLKDLQIPFVSTEWHRYAADLNRIPEDVDSSSVSGNANKGGLHPRGFHWVVTTLGTKLMTVPMSLATHEALVKRIYEPFHAEINEKYNELRGNLSQDKSNSTAKASCKEIFHLDVHSMPSVGTAMHRDPGEYRADVVVSDCHGKSSGAWFRDLVIAAYAVSGFKVRYNWPYFGGRVTEQYGNPEKGVHTIQVELNRALYMNEETKEAKADTFEATQKKISEALKYISNQTCA